MIIIIIVHHNSCKLIFLRITASPTMTFEQLALHNKLLRLTIKSFSRHFHPERHPVNSESDPLPVIKEHVGDEASGLRMHSGGR